MRCVNLHDDTIKILGVYYIYNKQFEKDDNFEKYIAKIENVLKLRRARNLSLTYWFYLKITYLALVKIIPFSIIHQLNKAQKSFICNGLNLKIKNSTINENYKNCALKNANIAAKISGLQSSWIKRLFDENFHEWKVLP